MTTIILVHGAWLDSRGWAAVGDILTAKGHRVIARDLPAHGASAVTNTGLATLSSYAESVLRDVDAAPDPVILVGHSMAGIVLSMVAEARPERIRHLVYVAAYLLRDGESIRDVSATDAESQVGPAMRPNADWSSVAIDPALSRGVFCNGLSDAATSLALKGMAAEPTGPLGEPVRITSARFGRVPRSYITTRDDRAVTFALQQRMLDASPCVTVMNMNTGHLPFIADPDTFSTCLLTQIAD